MMDDNEAGAAATGGEGPVRAAGMTEEEGRRWRGEIRAAQKAQSGWIERGRKIEKIYADRREDRSDRGRKFNVLWANVETLRPAVYMAPPKAAAARRQFDRDPVARLAAQLLERCLQASCELYDFDHTLDQMVRDWLLPGRGQAWIVYEPVFYSAGGARQSAVGNSRFRGNDGQSAVGDAEFASASIGAAPMANRNAGATLVVVPGAETAGAPPGAMPPSIAQLAHALGATTRFRQGEVLASSGQARVAPTDAPETLGPAMQQIAGAAAYGAEETEEDLAYEHVIADYVPWADFLHSAGARTWSEVEWVGRRLLFTRRKGRARFGAAFDAAPLTWRARQSAGGSRQSDEGDGRAGQAEVIEVWDKESGDVLFVAPEAPDDRAILKRTPAPIRFRNFFPCPRPLLATTTSDSLIPTPDYAQYQDQAQELNALTARIDKLQKALKLAGLYPAESKEIAKLIDADEGKMIAVEQWAMHAEDGGVRGMIEWFPVEQIITVLRELYSQRDAAKQNLFEISGIADVMRGVANPNETLGAQQIKQRWSGTRLRKRQKEVQRLAGEIFQLKAETIAEVFQFSTILEMAGVDSEMLANYAPAGTDPRAMLREVERMLRADAVRTFQIRVAPDSTLEPDLQAEQAGRAQVIQAVSTIMQQGAALASQGPEGAKLVGELIMFALRPFKDFDALEETVTQATEAAAKAIAARAAQPPPPNPYLEEMKLRAQLAQAEHALKQEKLKIDAQAQAAENQIRMREIEQKRIEQDQIFQTKMIELDEKRRERETAELAGLNGDACGHADRYKEDGGECSACAETDDAPSARPIHPGRREGIAEALLMAAEAMRDAASAMAAPKRLVRDPATGRAIGVECVVNGTDVGSAL
jgi:hypothetical protein